MRTLAAIAMAVALPASTTFADGAVDYASQVKPLLAQKCFACHGDDPEKIKGELAALSG